jgi:hypothetical protein
VTARSRLIDKGIAWHFEACGIYSKTLHISRGTPPEAAYGPISGLTSLIRIKSHGFTGRIKSSPFFRSPCYSLPDDQMCQTIAISSLRLRPDGVQLFSAQNALGFFNTDARG